MRRVFETGQVWPAAAGILLAGVVVAVVAGLVVHAVLRRIGDDEDEARNTATPVFWTVLAVFAATAAVGLLASAAQVAGSPEVADRLVVALPDLVVAVAIAVLGVIVAAMLREPVRAGLERLQPGVAPAGAAAAYWATIILAGLAAGAQVGLQTRLLEGAVLIVLAGAVLASAIAFGSGARALVAVRLAARHVERIVAPGDEVEVDRRRGTVRAIGPTSVTLDVGQAVAEVPHNRFLNGIVVVHHRHDVDEATQVLPTES